MTRLLVVGSEGFIGSAVAHTLSEKGEIFRADIASPTDKSNYARIDPIEPDLVGLIENVQPDVLINCSGAASVPLSFENPAEDFRLNVVVVVRMLDAIRKSAPHCRMVHLSSAAVYGNPAELPVNERLVPAPVSPYGWHKLYAEQICREYATLFGINTLSLRIFSCYGPGLRKQIFWDVFRKSREASAVSLFGSGSETRDFIFVDDLAHAIGIAIERAEFDGRAINAASGVMHTIREAVGTLLDHLGDGNTLQFSGEKRRGDPERWLADISYLASLSFKPRFTLSSGLERTAKWLREQG